MNRKTKIVPEDAYDRKLWERQYDAKGDAESSKAFDAFTIYRDMGPERTCTKVAAILGVHKQAIFKWSVQWYWTARVLAWEEELDKRKCQKKLQDIEEMHIRHSSHSKTIENALMVPVEAFIKRILKDKQLRRNTKFDSMSDDKLFALIKDIADKLPKVVDVERKSRGEPTDINSIQIDFSKMSDDELQRIANSGKG